MPFTASKTSISPELAQTPYLPHPEHRRAFGTSGNSQIAGQRPSPGVTLILALTRMVEYPFDPGATLNLPAVRNLAEEKPTPLQLALQLASFFLQRDLQNRWSFSRRAPVSWRALIKRRPSLTTEFMDLFV